MGAIVAALQGTEKDTGVNLDNLLKLNDYWIQVREMYAPFESGQKSAGGKIDHKLSSCCSFPSFNSLIH